MLRPIKIWCDNRCDVIEQMANTGSMEAFAMPDFPRSVLEFQQQFPDEAACAVWLAAARWPEGFRCPVCGDDHAWELDTKAWT